MREEMEVLILYHNTHSNKNPQEYDEVNMKHIASFKNMPRLLSVSCDFIEHIAIQHERLLIILHDSPARIDYANCPSHTIYILSFSEVEYCSKPYYLLPNEQHLSSTLWEAGERERVTLEEVGIP